MSNFELIEPLPLQELNRLTSLREYISELERVCIAYSGGVDSSLVAAISKEQLGKNAIAITGISAALAPLLLNEARNQANWIGITHKECFTTELKDPNYNQNPTNRCYACKRELHAHLTKISQEAGNYLVLDGVNFDDLKDHRPGITAAKEAGVTSPLADLKIGKESIRKISKALGFPWWNKPAEPCLSSRFPYGESISLEKLIRVAKAESWLKLNGFNKVRVRSIELAAKIEVPLDRIQELEGDLIQQKILKEFRRLGFKSIIVDPEGLISGKLNRQLK